MSFAELVGGLVDLLGSFTVSEKQRYQRKDDRPAKRQKIVMATAEATSDRPRTSLWVKGRRGKGRIAPTEIDGQEAND
ncbi:MAG: hypothetical protein ACOY4N_15295 [Pseudomonadota bacterium]|uniref:Uncharacterized protein n=1 Tax=Sphingobium xenophagum TaxID=121428 RepID=A0A249MW10_SPHXE|nr:MULTISPECIES: hypothetical protein [Sphingobium]ASY45536.1 hypothetical protein CJD35_14685 [Sphingobium xenophagum]QWT13869.1 hypothetical protein GTV57_14570 [Sphingobium xenophagum]